MKKKIMVFVVAVLAACLFLVGCGETTYEPVKVSGKLEVVSGNGTFLVETSDYVYYINGQGTYTDDNGFGKVLKGSLVRTKKANLASSDAKGVDVIIPKLLITSSNETGIYIFDNYVYYASPCVEKSKNGSVRSDAVTFFRYNLNTGKNETEITTIDSYVAYKFIENNGKVYLAFTKSETDDDDNTVNTYVCYDASKKDSLVYESNEYSTILTGDANTSTIYYTKAAYNETLEQDESFYELYKYVIGETSDTVVLGVTDTKTGKESFLGQESTQGYSLSLILNQEGYLIGSQTNLDSTYATVRYFAYNGTEFTDLGFDNTAKTAAITSSSILKVDGSFVFYYVSSENLISYTYSTTGETKNVISNKVSGYTLLDIDDNDVYLYADSVVYTLSKDSYNSDVYRLNEISLDTSTTVFMPRLVEANSTKYIVGIVTEEYGYSYPYSFDVGSKSDLKLVDDDALEVDSDVIQEFQKCLIGKVTDDDQESYDTYIEDLIESEEEEEDED